MKCINCNGESFKESDSFPGADACTGCGFLKAGTLQSKANIILPDDPMDSFACESCQ